MNDKKPDIKIFVSCHDDFFVPDCKILIPIQVGTIFSNKKFDNMLQDNIGDNISAKNKFYCELTAQYWVWKNKIKDADYFGFFHYRRYLNFSQTNYPEDGWGNIAYHEQLNDSLLRELNISDESLQDIIPKYDVIVPRRRTLPENEKTIYDQYCGGPGQHKEDLDCALAVLNEKYPEYAQTATCYMKSNQAYDCNMYIMKSTLFAKYMDFVFSILFEVEKRRDFSLYSMAESRVMGFLAERLFGIWFLYNREKQSLKTLELQKTLFYRTDRPLPVFSPHPNSVVTVLSSSDLYAPYLAAMLQSIIRHSSPKRKYEIYILTTSITEEHAETLRRLVEIDERFSFRCVNVSAYFDSKSLFVNQHIAVETYYRLIIPQLFADTNKVLFLDSDMIVNADIAQLFDTDITGSYLAAIKDIDIAGQLYRNERLKDYLEKNVGLSDAYRYFQAGCLLLNLAEMRKKYTSDDLMKIALGRQWTYLDQDVMNHAFNDKVVYLNQHWNTMMDWREPNASRMAILKNAPFALYDEYLAARKSPKIIHFAGYQKPWNTANCDFANYFWKYARETEFYEEILRRFCEAAAPNYGKELERRLAAKDSEIAELRGHLQHIERNMTSRRFLFKWAFSKSLWYRVLRKIWRMVRG